MLAVPSRCKVKGTEQCADTPEKFDRRSEERSPQGHFRLRNQRSISPVITAMASITRG